MKSIFDRTTRDEVVRRIGTLSNLSSAQWGKMRVDQMLRHCILYDQMILHGGAQKQTLLGRIFGNRVLKDFIKDEAPVKRNLPTLPQLRVKGPVGDVPGQKARWIALINEYESYAEPCFVHPFFGKMTREQVGQLDYKHADHHLRQFCA